MLLIQLAIAIFAADSSHAARATRPITVDHPHNLRSYGDEIPWRNHLDNPELALGLLLHSNANTPIGMQRLARIQDLMGTADYSPTSKALRLKAVLFLLSDGLPSSRENFDSALILALINKSRYSVDGFERFLLHGESSAPSSADRREVERMLIDLLAESVQAGAKLFPHDMESLTRRVGMFGYLARTAEDRSLVLEVATGQ
jgi:hypothetical protein